MRFLMWCCVDLFYHASYMDGEKDKSTAVTRGSTHENSANLPVRFLKAIKAEFGGSQLARQEIDGELLEDLDGALWNRAMIELVRVNSKPVEFRRIVTGYAGNELSALYRF